MYVCMYELAQTSAGLLAVARCRILLLVSLHDLRCEHRLVSDTCSQCVLRRRWNEGRVDSAVSG